MNTETIQFLLTTFMELATLLCAYMGLRLFKKSWKLRMALIVVPLLANAILYAIYETTPFFYLGVILLLCLPFVWPRKSA
jgi:peptidoglycan/LPS O-acetylase OafA/YrhL